MNLKGVNVLLDLYEKYVCIDCTIIILIRIVDMCYLRRSTLYNIVYVSGTFI